MLRACSRHPREAALAALQDGELKWEIVYTSPNLTGVRAAALAGLAITPLPASAVIAGLRILDAEAGLPRRGQSAASPSDITVPLGGKQP